MVSRGIHEFLPVRQEPTPTNLFPTLKILVGKFSWHFGCRRNLAGFPSLPWAMGTENPDIPDTCYCPRCLAKFEADAGIRIGEEAKTVAEKAAWIHDNAGLPWMAWKKEQVASFAREVKQLIGRLSGDRSPRLGAFLVPWRKADHDGALSVQLAQDAKLLAFSVDVFSPMVYHRMVQQPVAWVGEITDYYADMTGREIWPIIQAEKVGGEEFAQVLQTLSRPSVQGVLVYKYSDMTDEHWPLLARYKEPPNLLANPLLQKTADRAGKSTAATKAALPDEWFSVLQKDVQDSKFWHKEQDDGNNVIGLIAGYDRQAIWSTDLPDC